MCSIIENVKTPKTENRMKSSPSSLVCRICFDNESRDNKLIRPCSCSGSVAYAHNSCLERWVRATMNTKCTICQDEFELVAIGMKNFRDCSLPYPLSDEAEDVLDFWCTLAWIVYMSRFAYIAMRHGAKIVMDELDVAMRNGIIRSVWWLSFWFNFLYYGAMAMLIYEKWTVENTMFRFKDRSAGKTDRASTRSTARNHSINRETGPLSSESQEPNDRENNVIAVK